MNIPFQTPSVYDLWLFHSALRFNPGIFAWILQVKKVGKKVNGNIFKYLTVLRFKNYLYIIVLSFYKDCQTVSCIFATLPPELDFKKP